MKTSIKLFALGMILMGLGVNAQAQLVTETATAAATVVTPLTITKVTNMNFGILAVNATTPGTLILSTAGGRTQGGGVMLSPANPGTITAATFNIAGEDNYTYAITLPSAAVELVHTNATDKMTATAFTSDPGTTGLLDGSGAQVLKVGATLNVAAAQLAGVYTSANFDVKVNYN